MNVEILKRLTLFGSPAAKAAALTMLIELEDKFAEELEKILKNKEIKECQQNEISSKP
jgi:hypothetical protein